MNDNPLAGKLEPEARESASERDEAARNAPPASDVATLIAARLRQSDGEPKVSFSQEEARKILAALPSPQQGAQTLDELRDLLAKATKPGQRIIMVTIGEWRALAVDKILKALPHLLDRAEAADKLEGLRGHEAGYIVVDGLRVGPNMYRSLAARAIAAEARADALAESLKGLLAIEEARIATGAFRPNEQGQAAIDRARQALGARDEA